MAEDTEKHNLEPEELEHTESEHDESLDEEVKEHQDVDATGSDEEAAENEGEADTAHVEEDEAEASDSEDASEEVSEADNADEVETEHMTVEQRKAKRSVRHREQRAQQQKASTTADKPLTQEISLPKWSIAAIAVACILVGVLVGHFLLGGISAQGRTTLSENELNTVVATMSYEGKTYDITAQEAIEATSTLDAMKNDDGTYNMPSAESAISAARNKVLQAEVEKAGITVSDADVQAYAEEYLGTSDYAQIAEQYGMDEASVKEVLTEAAGTRKLYDSVVTETSITAPTAPEEPEEGQEDTPNATYGAYIVGLLGDEWDADANTWARTDGPFYSALGSEQFSADSATYNQALTAYYTAYQQYVEEYSQSTSAWTDFYNGCLSNATIDVSTLTA